MGIKGCWTCRCKRVHLVLFKADWVSLDTARKVRCDLTRPACNACNKSQYFCRGYGIQLSWPRQGDKRRALINSNTKEVGTSSRRNRRTQPWFLNTFVWEIALSEALQKQRDHVQYTHTHKVQHLPFLQPSLLSGNNAILLDFFNKSQSHILTPIIDAAVAHVIMRVALSDLSSHFNLILEGVFAIAALQLQERSQSLIHQSRLVSMLRENLPRTDRESVLQNLIASMLLYQYEILTTPGPGDRWAFYLCGAKRIIEASSSIFEFRQDESMILKSWVYYHEVISEFSLRHWATASTWDSFCTKPRAVYPYEFIIEDSVISNILTCPVDVLDLIRRICKPSLICEDTMHDKIEAEEMQQLTRYIQKAVGEFGSFHDSSETSLTKQEMLAYLYRCAALIYYNRVVAEVPASSFQHKRLVREGYSLLHHLDCCESAWPLLIIACEADNDERRLQALEIFSKMEQDPARRSNHIPSVRSMVQAVWNQNDLNIDSDVNYITTLQAVVSTAPSLPLFA